MNLFTKRFLLQTPAILAGIIIATIGMAETTSPAPEEKPTLPAEQFCNRMTFEGKSYIVCRANPARDTISLFLNNADGKPFKHFQAIEKELQKQGKTFAFAMNAGMYHRDYSPVGLYIENGIELKELSTMDGPGNFHMKPNGVFFIKDNKAAVMDTEAFILSGIEADLATQSGPMLLINNEIHPRFIPDSPYIHYRNGVGVDESGEVYFVISENKVFFQEMARFFRDALHTPNALYFDGSISSIYVPELNRYDWWHALGPIIGVVITTPQEFETPE